MTRNRNNRKSVGIEPIVAAILLIVITVVAAVLLYMWFSGYLSATTSKVSSMATPEQFQVVAASLSATSGLTAYVQNTGSVTVTITGIYLLNSTNGGLICELVNSSGFTPVQINPGTTREVTIAAPIAGCSISSGTTYELLFVTSEGTKYTTSVVASS
ncbi:archaellin/type IV pilin N-terminal domain-containing protein [Vulcanisaeta sp. JCM 16159]|uniref:archaellin/type IV pilin N-terminal domain-containing protein n=1 Tax=Vulcanisaeta sp. JCM 16159 TaxID=1295371 RepID=UPI0006D0F271|nr:archaellin/type IV pilin N-terminal domain-containing protein [Vulcanisaeta sp. JCM 16159]